MTDPDNKGAAFEYVFEQEVHADRLERYYAFSDKLRELVSRQPGFVSFDRFEMGEAGDIRRFRTLLKFDTVEHCVCWLDHPERRRLLNQEEKEADFVFQGHGNWNGYARWLSSRITSAPPKWKVNLLVLLTLYPTVMLLTPLLHLTLKGFSFPSVMLISNALCVAATSWVLVPVVSRFYLRWLEGEQRSMSRALAVISLLILFGLLFFLFKSLPTSLWG